MCERSNLRLEIEVSAGVEVDDAGVAADTVAVTSLMDNVREWQPALNDPYYCIECDRDFKLWTEAIAHLGTEVSE